MKDHAKKEVRENKEYLMQAYEDHLLSKTCKIEKLNDKVTHYKQKAMKIAQEKAAMAKSLERLLETKCLEAQRLHKVIEKKEKEINKLKCGDTIESRLRKSEAKLKRLEKKVSRAGSTKKRLARSPMVRTLRWHI